MFSELTALTCCPLDGRAPGDNLPDFKILDHGNQIGTLEVTRATDERALEAQGAVKDNRFELQRTSRTWSVMVEPTTIVKGLGGVIQQIVDHLERKGLDRVSRWQPLGQKLGLANNGITCVARVPAATEPVASVMVVGLGGPTARDVLAEVAEREVAKNVKKVGPPSPLAGHLWVWLEFEAPDGASAMAYSIQDGLPGRPPRRPRLDAPCTVWLAIHGERWALRWRDTDGWTLVG